MKRSKVICSNHFFFLFLKVFFDFLKFFINCCLDDYQFVRDLLFLKMTNQFYRSYVRNPRSHLVVRGKKDRYDQDLSPNETKSL